MLAFTLKGCRKSDEIFFLHTFDGNHGSYAGLAFGKSSCFIKDNRSDCRRTFKRLGRLYQNALRSAQTGTYHDGGRRCKTKCTGARNYQYRHGMRKSDGKITRRKHKQPADKGEKRQYHDHRHKDTCNGIGAALYRSL